MLKLLMVGAGGIGGYYAARLSRAGHDVVLTARCEHLHAIENRGLTVRYGGDEWNCRLPVFDHAHLLKQYRADDFDLVLLALKSTATEPVLHELGPWLGKGSVALLSLQNGVDNEPMIAAAIGANRTLGGLAVRIGGHIVEPGMIEAEGVGQVVMGEWPEAAPQPDTRRLLLKTLEAAFNKSGIPATVSPRIRHELWRKLVINNGVNPLSALTGLDTRSLTQHPKFGKLVYAMMAETVAASRADGVNLGQQDLDEMFALISSFNAIKTSMLIDKEKGRPLELDSIAGAVLRRSETLGIDAPYTTTVNALLEHGLG